MGGPSTPEPGAKKISPFLNALIGKYSPLLQFKLVTRWCNRGYGNYDYISNRVYENSHVAIP